MASAGNGAKNTAGLPAHAGDCRDCRHHQTFAEHHTLGLSVRLHVVFAVFAVGKVHGCVQLDSLVRMIGTEQAL